MIVCICRAKSDRDVAAAIERGASSVRDVQGCGIGTDCGSCHDMIRRMITAAGQTAVGPVSQRPSSPATLASPA